ncbi:MAG TPA: hypothetical protein VGC66_10175 [Pyrinomonadaceae bacterium]
MKRNLMVASVALLVFASGLIVAAAKANFGGTWTLDKSKSEGLPAYIKDQVLTVKQTGDKLDIESKLTTEQGDQTITDVYTLDGKPADFTSKGPGGAEGKGKRTAKWSADGNGIEVSEAINYETPNGSVAVDITRKWTLSADGKSLTIEMNVVSPMGTQQIKRVMVKKS